MEICSDFIDQATDTIVTFEYCDGIHDENCHEFHPKYTPIETLSDFDKSIVEDVYNYYIRCVNYIKDKWEGYKYGKMPDVSIMKMEDLYLDHANEIEDSVITKTIITAHKLHDRALRSKEAYYDFDGCECRGYTPAFTGRCDCGNRRVRLTHKGLGINWMDSFNLDSTETVSIPVGY
ncbi:hypothetical protein [Moumouvirus maliensis]|nr:hypothetical protein [Moumouvirus maliensis]